MTDIGSEINGLLTIDIRNKCILFILYPVKLPSRFYSGGKVYVDPKTYPDVDDAVNEFAFEIQLNELKIGEKIGEGEFADVFKATLYRNGQHSLVAVKMLKVLLFF